MNVNVYRVLELCIEEGINDALNSYKDKDQLADKISEHILLQLDYYFDFEDN